MRFRWSWIGIISLSVLFWGKLAQSLEISNIGNAFTGFGQSDQHQQDSIDRLLLSQMNVRREADRFSEQGINFFTASRYPEAIHAFERALTLYQQLATREEEARTLGNLGTVYSSLAEYQQSRELHERSLAIKREIGDREGIVASLNILGNIEHLQGQYRQAIDFFEQSLNLARRIGGRSHEASALGNLGLAHSELAEYERAYDYYDQSYTIIRELGDRRREASILSNQGYARNNLGGYREAIRLHQQALEIYREFGDRRSEALALGNLGVSYSALGDYEQATELQEESLAIRREVGDRSGEISSLASLGEYAYSIGSYQQSLGYHKQALELSREIGDRAGEVNALGGFADTYVQLGNYRKAIDFYERALEIEREIGAQQSVSHSIGNLGLTYSALGDYVKAVELYEESLEMAISIGDRKAEADLLMSLGGAQDSLGDNTRAIELKKRALAISRDLGDRQGEANTLGSLGDTYSNLKDYSQAIRFYNQSLELTQANGNRDRQALGLSKLGEVYLKQGDAVSAESYLSDAVSILDGLRSPDLSDGDRITFFETQSDAYKNLEVALIQQNKQAKALEAAEHGRARSFVQILSENLLPVEERGVLVQVPTFSDFQRIAAEQQSVLVEYSIITEPDDSQWIYVWIVQPNGALNFKKVELKEELGSVSELVGRSRKAIGVRSRGGFELANDISSSDLTEVLRELHQLLIEPISGFLPDDPDQRVVFIPQGELFLVPFPALIDEFGEYLIANHTMLTAPSAQVLDLTRQRANARRTDLSDIASMLAIGNPVMPEVWNSETETTVQLSTLKGAEKEAIDIAKLFGVNAVIKEQATEQVVKQRIENARIVHFATHGLLEYGNPKDLGVRGVPGAIALAPTENDDGFLTSAEVLELNLQAELVVLSACDTGLGDITGDGVIGLSRSLISAGALNVVVSLWSVPDAPTAELMVEFYQQMQQGEDKAQALRQAMLATKENHPNPTDWAAFTLIGATERGL